jgi:hypothetical protein
MKTLKTARYVALVGALLAGGAVAAAQIDVRTGGVGEEERAEFMRSYGEYNLHLAFAEMSGAFLADVDVRIQDARGQELWSGTVDGPMLFARVPSGRYTVIAEFGGETKQRTIEVGSAPAPMQYVHWNVPGVGDAVAGGSPSGGR